MNSTALIIRLGGESGEGIISAGEILTLGIARLGYWVYTFRTYPAEIKGGPSMFQVRVSDHRLFSMGDALDVLVAFNEEAYNLHHGDLRRDGVLVYDPDAFTPPNNGRIHYAVPLTTIASKEVKSLRSKNMIAIGAVAGLFGLDSECLTDAVSQQFAAKAADLREKNLLALQTGFNFGRTRIEKRDPYRIAAVGPRAGAVVVSGNEAVALGAIAAGCKFFAGYPITPATDILELLARELPAAGGSVVQVEDEMAALAAVLGASFAGQKAMTATSGPGFSLMTELLGLAGMAEIPAVIIDAQRAGPSTGMPTKMEQGDLAMAAYASHGEAPRLVLAPTSAEDCFWITVEAFNLAETYQMPVIVLSDQSLSHRTETIERPDLSKLKIVNRLRPVNVAPDDYRRYVITESGISPMAVPGIDPTFYSATGLEHDERGHPDYSPEGHTRMTQKRQRKLRTAEANSERLVLRFGSEQPEIGLIAWGSTYGAAREAVERAMAQGVSVAMLCPRMLNPLPDNAIREFVKGLKRIIVPEVNYAGQLANLLSAQYGIQAERVNKYGGLPFRAIEILEAIQ
jgi:2-oxoglutarate ferredoxin oxidoreductase subunit alpha